MQSLKGHFDGKSIVLDEPATLVIGQAVRVVVDSAASSSLSVSTKSSFNPHLASTAAALNGKPFDERDALIIDPIDAVPPDFVRQPGSGAGEIWIAEDFDETPDDFKEYM